MNSTILIVDDIRSNIYVLADILDNNYKVIPATSGVDAITLLALKRIDLMLIDVFMPGMDGYDVLKFMKEHNEYAKIPVILSSEDYDIDIEAKGFTLGADDFIRKPYNGTIVRAKVQKHIELKSYCGDMERVEEEQKSLLLDRVKQLEAREHKLVAIREVIIMGMSLMSEIHDAHTAWHVERIKRITEILTNEMMKMFRGMLTLDQAEQIVLYSPLHDIGKAGISDIILKKTDLLTAQEFEVMKSHTIDGVELLKKMQLYFANGGVGKNNSLHVAIEIVGSHHERFDGSGYPFGLKGEEIPISARIVAVADVYDALRSERPYKKAVNHDEAVNIINAVDSRTRSLRFDPSVIAAFNSAEAKISLLY